MKILNLTKFLSERMKIIPISNNELGKINGKLYNYYPKDKRELMSIIDKRIKEEGNECDLNDIDTSKITDMSRLFYYNSVLSFSEFNGNISEWDVSNVTNMTEMFRNASKFNCDISQWDVSKVTSMISMFDHAKSFNQNISKWNMSNVKNIAEMFLLAESFNQDISNWDVSNVEYMGHFLHGAISFDQDLSKWDVKKIKSHYLAFEQCPLQYKPEKQPKFYEGHIFKPLNNISEKMKIMPISNDELNKIDEFDKINNDFHVLEPLDLKKTKFADLQIGDIIKTKNDICGIFVTNKIAKKIFKTIDYINNGNDYFITFHQNGFDNISYINAIHYKSYFPMCDENTRFNIVKAWRYYNKLNIDKWEKQDFIDFYDKIKSEININD